MAIQIHEWFIKFCEAYGLNPNIERSMENRGLWKLNYQIKDSRTGVYSDRYENLLCIPLAEFRQWSSRADEFTDFVYDKKTGYIIVNMRYNSMLSHEVFVGCMFNAIEGVYLDENEAAERYIDKYGFFKSSVANYGPWKRINIGDNYIISADEKIAFKEYNFERLSD